MDKTLENENLDGNILVRTKELTKVYKGRNVLDGVSMNVPKGSIYGFIGKNGAGKTTTMRIILGLARPTKGTVELSDEYKGNSRMKLSAVIENPSFFPNMNAESNMLTLCYSLGIKKAKDETKNLLELVGLDPKDTKKVKNYSLGMKQRLSLAMSLIGEPSLLLLDEPMNGLDPEGIREIRDTIVNLNKERGVTIIMSSHILSELEKVATHYGVISNGKISAEFPASDLRKKVQGCIRLTTNDNPRAIDLLKESLSISKVESRDGEILIFDDVSISDVTQTLVSKDLIIDSINSEKGNYEEYFIKLMGGK